MAYIIYAIRLAVTIYSLMLLIRIFGSWFPRIQQSIFMRFFSHYTDPYLNLFRRFIPPIGGFLDLSPMLGFFSLQFLQWLLIQLLLLI